MSDISAEDSDSSVVSDTFSFSQFIETPCVKIQLPKHLLAYTDKYELLRETEPLACANNLIEEVMSNYVILKQIISNLPWQDKLMCKLVCWMWYSVVQTLQKEQQNPEDYVIELPIKTSRNNVTFKKSGEILTEPLAVLTFSNMLGFNIHSKCGYIHPNQCSPPCDQDHCLIDAAQMSIVAPKDCMLTVRACYISLMPLPSSITYEHVLTHRNFLHQNPIISGVIIPKIPDVEFHMINIKAIGDMQKDFYDVLDRIAETRTFKGILAYATESYLLHSVEDIVFLNYFNELQPDIPYAFGGCIVEDTVSDSSYMNIIVENCNKDGDFVSTNLVTIGLFTIPKNTNGCNFDMFSLIVESSDWTKAKIEKTINEFAKNVPNFEHSVALKLSCIGRDQKNDIEQEYFRAAFPRTRLIGCFGNGELGIDHPKKPPIELTNPIKRHKRDPGPQFGIMYSYSTVFVYIGWGKVLSIPKAT